MAQLDEAKLQELVGKVVGDVAGAMGIYMAYLGDQAGLYTLIDAHGRMTVEELAEASGMHTVYLREWLGANTAAGYISYDAETEQFWLSEEQALIFTREGQPVCMQGFFQAVIGAIGDHEPALETFRSGKGRPWGNLSTCSICAVDRFFRPGYEAMLVAEWIPALEGVTAKLEAGGKVADIGCGYGSSTLLMAKAFPNSEFIGIDIHEPSVEKARQRAAKEGLTNVTFHAGTAQDFDGEGFDLACIFDALHDMGDPVGAARQIRKAIAEDGTFMLVEPMAGDSLSENLHPFGQIYYGFSTVMCTPNSLNQDVALGLGAQAGQKRLTEVLNEAGWNNVRRAAETPTNMVLEVRA
ncbi:MAG: class I SAM-dependent methyltransferase [Polymorphobacter sp.]|uniref:class I SAM-dependent methyltransferase n=1 Tax=Polymorphobacter sp. TaxID=1909290 RepID=UPI003A8944C2